MSVFVPRSIAFLDAWSDPDGADTSHGMTYRTSTVDWRNTLIRVKTLFGARIVAVGPYGKKAAREKADEMKVTWNGMD